MQRISALLLRTLVVLLLSGVGILHSQASPAQLKDSAVSLEGGPVREFGRVDQGAVVTAQFVLHNQTATPLVIRKVRFSMPGMTFRAQQVVAPGSSGVVHIAWNTAGFTGKVRGQAKLYLSDPARPTLLLALSGLVTAPVDVLPMPAFYLSQFSGEETRAARTIRNNTDHALTITGLEAKGTHFVPDVATVKAGREYRLDVKVPKTVATGRYRESLLLYTDSPERPVIGIEVNVLVKADLYSVPDVADFGKLPLTEMQRSPGAAALTGQTLLVKRRQGKMRITGVSSDIPFLQLSVTPSGSSTSFKLDTGVDFGRAKPGPFKGQIVLQTDDVQHPELEIPVSGVITP